jgi:hypothetical protein
LQGNDIYNAATNEPFYNDPHGFQRPTSPTRTRVGPPVQTATSPIGAQGLTNLNPYYPAPGVAQFSLGVQREVRPSLIWVVQYVGNIAWHQNIERNINNYSLNTPFNTPLAIYSRDLGDRATIPEPTLEGRRRPRLTCSATTQVSPASYQEENTTNGTYNGFQTGLRAQNKHGLSGEIDYTWSHEIDITTYDLGFRSATPINLKYDKGSGALDRRNILSINYIYAFPEISRGQQVCAGSSKRVADFRNDDLRVRLSHPITRDLALTSTTTQSDWMAATRTARISLESKKLSQEAEGVVQPRTLSPLRFRRGLAVSTRALATLARTRCSVPVKLTSTPPSTRRFRSMKPSVSSFRIRDLQHL